MKPKTQNFKQQIGNHIKELEEFRDGTNRQLQEFEENELRKNNTRIMPEKTETES